MRDAFPKWQPVEVSLERLIGSQQGNGLFEGCAALSEVKS
jgi:hypothetical protein